MNYEEARRFVKNSEGKGISLGLEVMKQLLLAMGNPQDDLKFVHIAGTNGKGSVLAYISSVLKESGFKTGRYLSPSLFGYEEKIQVNEEWIPKEMVAEGITEIAHYMECDLISPTVFEIETALAFWYFKKKQCDIVVLETGMGGDLDATNIIKTAVCTVVVSISMDHNAILGNTLTEIASHKAGIIKPGVPVVLMRQESEVEAVIEKRCQEQNSELILADTSQSLVCRIELEEQHISYKNDKPLCTHLMGVHQKDNLAAALETLKILSKAGFPINEEQLETGIRNTRWKGRLELIHKNPICIVDGAHNPAAARKLRKSLEIYFTNQTFIFIIGVLADKDYHKILEIMMPLAKKVITITPDNPRALPAEKLAEAAKEQVLKQQMLKQQVLKKRMPKQSEELSAFCEKESVTNDWDCEWEECILIENQIEEAWKKAKDISVKTGCPIVSFGSLSFIARLEHCVKEELSPELRKEPGMEEIE